VLTIKIYLVVDLAAIRVQN